MNHRGITSARAEGSKFSQGVAAFLLLLFLSVQLLAAVPALHHALHHDAPSSEHRCAVTLLTSGSVEVAVAVVAVAALALLGLGNFLLRTEVLLSAVSWRLLPGRAPPRFV